MDITDVGHENDALSDHLDEIGAGDAHTAFLLYCSDIVGIDPMVATEETVNEFEDSYGGRWYDKKDWAYEYAEIPFVGIPADSPLSQYFDWDMYLHDCETGGMTFILDSEYRWHAFRSI